MKTYHYSASPVLGFQIAYNLLGEDETDYEISATNGVLEITLWADCLTEKVQDIQVDSPSLTIVEDTEDKLLDIMMIRFGDRIVTLNEAIEQIAQSAFKNRQRDENAAFHARRAQLPVITVRV